ncbi:MAG: hypothetical protein ACE5JO_12730 [Candidatus Binatia bacterium]
MMRVHGRLGTSAGTSMSAGNTVGSAMLTTNIAPLAKMRRVTQGVMGKYLWPCAMGKKVKNRRVKINPLFLRQNGNYQAAYHS